ncbi:Protein bli-3 [Cladophialophora carrionii]|uniref:Protein bli-3 n=1 Tax=Cladophialophora carrionii TaxID=86049 RepID=A0A1C1CYI2_9EURO|nr:Protein bli-3 [Cladophialophora carrionii]
MPEPLHANEVNTQTDPSVAKQYDRETPKEQQWKELYEMIDGKKISILSTYRAGVGPVGRSMGVAKRVGPDILYLANKHSRKFSDMDKNKEVQITFQDSKTQDWISITGTATTTSNDDPRIKELYSSAVSAWFGDLKDGVHDGTWKDPRMSLIEVQSKYIVYWKKETSALGFMKEVGTAALTGGVAQTGVQRELSEEDIRKERV